MDPVRELPYWPAAKMLLKEAGQMAASDYVPNPISRLHLSGRPQMPFLLLSAQPDYDAVRRSTEPARRDIEIFCKRNRTCSRRQRSEMGYFFNMMVAFKDPANLYKERHLIECRFAKLKQFRRVATRYEKTARNYLAIVTLAATILWLR
jgi:transposase